MLGLLPGGGHFWLFGNLRDRLRSWKSGLGRSGGIDNSPPRTTSLHPSPRSICSAEGSVRLAFGPAG
jgi:hypothetical protein